MACAAPSHQRGDLQHRISQLLLFSSSPSRPGRSTPFCTPFRPAPLRSTHHLAANDEWMRRRGIDVSRHDEPEHANDDRSPSTSRRPASPTSSSAPASSTKSGRSLSGFFDARTPLRDSSRRRTARAAPRIQARRRFLPADSEGDAERPDPDAAWAAFSALDDEARSKLSASDLMHMWWSIALQDLGIEPSSAAEKPPASDTSAHLLAQLADIDALIESRPEAELSRLTDARVLAAHRSAYIRSALSEQTSFYTDDGSDGVSHSLGDEISHLVSRIHDLGFRLEPGLLARLTRTLARQGATHEALRMLERDLGPDGPEGKVELLPDGQPSPPLDKVLLKSLGELVMSLCSRISAAQAQATPSRRDRELHRALKTVQMAFSIAKRGRPGLLRDAIEAAARGPNHRNELWRLMSRSELKALLPRRLSQEVEEQDLPDPSGAEEREYRAPLWLDRVLSAETKGHVAEEVCIALAAKDHLAPAIAYLRIASQSQDEDEGLRVADDVMPPPPTSRLSFELISHLRHRMGAMLPQVWSPGERPSRKTSVEIDSAATLLLRVYADLIDAGIVPDDQCHADMINGLSIAVRHGWRPRAQVAEEGAGESELDVAAPQPVSRLEETFNRFIQAFAPAGHQQARSGNPAALTQSSTGTSNHLLQLRSFTSSLLTQDPSLQEPHVIRPADVKLLLQLHVELLDATFARRIFESVEAARLRTQGDEGEDVATESHFINADSALYLVRDALLQRPRDVTFALRVLAHVLDSSAAPNFSLPQNVAALLLRSVLRRGDSALVAEAWARLGEMGTRLRPRLARVILEGLCDVEDPNAETIIDIAEQLQHLPVSGWYEEKRLMEAHAKALDAASCSFSEWTAQRRERILSLFDAFRSRLAEFVRGGGEADAPVVRMAYHAAARTMIGEAALEVGDFDEPPALSPSPFADDAKSRCEGKGAPNHQAEEVLDELNNTLGIPSDYQTMGLRILLDIVPDRRAARERLLQQQQQQQHASGDEREGAKRRSDLFEVPVADERLDRAMQTFQRSLGATEHVKGIIRRWGGKGRLGSALLQVERQKGEEIPPALQYLATKGTERNLRLRTGVAGRLMIALGRARRFDDARYVYDAFLGHHKPLWGTERGKAKWKEGEGQGDGGQRLEEAEARGSTRPLVGRRTLGVEGAMLGILAMQGRSEEWRYRLARIRIEEGFHLTEKMKTSLLAWEARARRDGEERRRGARGVGAEKSKRAEEKRRRERERQKEEAMDRERRDIFRRLASGQPARRRP